MRAQHREAKRRVVAPSLVARPIEQTGAGHALLHLGESGELLFSTFEELHVLAEALPGIDR